MQTIRLIRLLRVIDQLHISTKVLTFQKQNLSYEADRNMALRVGKEIERR